LKPHLNLEKLLYMTRVFSAGLLISEERRQHVHGLPLVSFLYKGYSQKKKKGVRLHEPLSLCFSKIPTNT
jgi:hypothetical protein